MRIKRLHCRISNFPKQIMFESSLINCNHNILKHLLDNPSATCTILPLIVTDACRYLLLEVQTVNLISNHAYRHVAHIVQRTRTEPDIAAGFCITQPVQQRFNQFRKAINPQGYSVDLSEAQTEETLPKRIHKTGLLSGEQSRDKL